MFLTSLSLKRPVLVTVSLLALVALGLISCFTLSINDWPEIKKPYVTITILQPGASPDQMERNVAQKVEEALSEIAGVKHVYSIIQESSVTVWAEFTMETEEEQAIQDVRDNIGLIRNELPEDIEEPVIDRFDPTAAPIMILALTGRQSVREMSILTDDMIKKRIESINGVGAVNIIGAESREIQILLDKNKLAQYGLSIPEIIAGLQSHNLEVPAGNLNGQDKQINLRTSARVKTVDDFNRLPVGRRGETTIHISDIATVADGIKERESLAYYQGRPAVAMEVIKQSGSNTVEIANKINETVKSLQKDLPPGVELNIVRDNSVGIRNSVNDIVKTLLEGSILAVLTVFLFLRNVRSTLISALAILTSIIISFLAMKVLGFTLNNMSLMALSLSVGLLIDDAIVVIENIIRHLQQGKSPLQAARDASQEIGLAVTATTFTLVAVFLPVGMMTGEVGQYFKELGITVACSVLVSLLVAFTLVPLLASRYLSSDAKPIGGGLGRFLGSFNHGFTRFGNQYSRLLALSLKHRAKTLAMALTLFAASLFIVPLLGSGFVPSADLGEFNVVAEFDPGIDLDAARQLTADLEQVIRTFPAVEKTYANNDAEQAKIFIKIVPKDERQQSLRELADDMRQELKKVPGVRTTMLFAQGAMIEEKDWEFRMQGQDREVLQSYAEKAVQILESIPGAVDVASSYKPAKPELQLKVKTEQAADLGITAGQIAQTLNTLLSGTVVNKYEEDQDGYDVRLRLEGSQRQNLQDLDNVYLPGAYPTKTGENPQVALSQVTEPVFSTTPSVLNRSDRYKEIIISGNRNGISLGELNRIFLAQAGKEISMQPGYRIYAGGDSERMEDTFSSMITALILAVLFIFFILAAQFESYIDPFSIMLSLPMAAIGAFLGLLATKSDLDLISMIGIIMLMGLVTKNAILLIDFVKQARAGGMERESALLQAARTRLRPIMMTTTAMILGMIPLALSLGAGSEQRSSMAHAVIGGLITSTFLTLIIVPVVYSLLDDLKLKVTQSYKSKRGKVLAD